MTSAVLAMAYGTPRSASEILTFYTDVRRGRPPTDEQLADLEGRYAAIGGSSPLAERTLAQVKALGAALDDLAPNRFSAYFGARHAEPKIEASVAEIAADGISHLVGLVLAPHYSRLSVGAYLERASAAAAEHGMSFTGIERWHEDPTLITLLAKRVNDALVELGGGGEGIALVVTAHSLPETVLTNGDRYVEEVSETAALVATACGLSARVAWQSAGRTPDPWIGPSIDDVLAEVAAESHHSVIVCPAGFTSDHLEVLYDLDIEARRIAEGLGLAFARTASLNDDPELARALARLVIATEERS